MGLNDYYMTLVSNGQWVLTENKHSYEGTRKVKGIMVEESIKFEVVKMKIVEKLGYEQEIYDLQLRYVSPVNQNFPPSEITDEDDWEAFKFLNLKSNELVWPMELYSSLVLKEFSQFDMKPNMARHNSIEETIIPLSAPLATQTQTQEDPSGKTTFLDADRTSYYDDKSIDDLPEEEDDDIIPVKTADRISREDVRKYFQRKDKSIEIVELSSDDDVVDLGSSEDEHGGGEDYFHGENEWNEEKVYEEEWHGEEEGGTENEFPYEMDEAYMREVEEIEYNYLRSQKDAKMHKDYAMEYEDEMEVDTGKKTVKVGEFFNTKEELKDALNSMALEKCYQISVKKSDKTLYVVGCVDKNCTFKCRGSIYGNTKLFQVRQFAPEHSCSMGVTHNHHKQASSRFIADKILPKYLRGAKGPKASEIQDLMQEMGVKASYHKANRARLKAQDLARGTSEESYARLYSYLFMLEKSNPGSHTRIVRDASQRFKYVFWSLGAWIRALPNLRKVISVDGAHLSARYRGVLVLTTAQDGNGQIYLVAFGVVDSENDDSWSFFFRELRVIVPDEPDLVIVSDRHQSIGNGLRNNYLLAKHGCCTYHLYQNFKSSSKRGDLFSLFDKVSRAYTIPEFNRLFSQLRSQSVKVADYLQDAGFKNWARAYFSSNRYNILTSNNAESMNSRFKEQRAWPITAMFDEMIAIMAKWFCERREKAGKWDDMVTSDVKGKLDKRYLKSLRRPVRRLSDVEAEVIDGTTRFAVNLHSRTCDCRKFQIDQYPCTHAIAVAADRGINYTELVHHMFSNEKLKEVYKETLHLVPPVDRWDVPQSIASTTCLPPEVRKRPGRPKVNRYRANWERDWSKMRRCGRCRAKGHNQRNCRKPKALGAAQGRTTTTPP